MRHLDLVIWKNYWLKKISSLVKCEWKFYVHLPKCSNLMFPINRLKCIWFQNFIIQNNLSTSFFCCGITSGKFWKIQNKWRNGNSSIDGKVKVAIWMKVSQHKRMVMPQCDSQIDRTRKLIFPSRLKQPNHTATIQVHSTKANQSVNQSIKTTIGTYSACGERIIRYLI